MRRRPIDADQVGLPLKKFHVATSVLTQESSQSGNRRGKDVGLRINRIKELRS